ncbi:ATP-dependent DNA helicase Q4 [Excalfactoria chinensis]|uniref:ATP-dependent DNA helicase Q4 n=1 Tax=Excalfactoria chinensis TaxID=46218 RepID=UPI003B3A5D6F
MANRRPTLATTDPKCPITPKVDPSSSPLPLIGPNGGRRLQAEQIAAAYHAGLSASERRRVQSAFMKGQLRVVVATVAFGMGLDKADVRAVLHYNMPRSFEAYVQEIGRAGRDGETAWCHLFIDKEGSDRLELRRHIFADAADPFAITRLVRAVFPPCKCRELQRRRLDLQAGAEVSDQEMAAMMDAATSAGGGGDDVTGSRGGGVTSEEEDDDVMEVDDDVIEPEVEEGERQRVCYKHERAIAIERAVMEMDLREEAIETLLCYLELHPQRWVELLPHTYGVCTVKAYGGTRELRAARPQRQSSTSHTDRLTIAPQRPHSVLQADRLNSAPQRQPSEVQFDVVELSDRMGWELPSVKRELRGLRGSHDGSIQVCFSSLSFHIRSYGDLRHLELDAACSFLRQRLEDQQRGALRQLNQCHRAFHSVAFQGCDPQPTEEEEEERSLRLKALLRDYFETETHGGGGEEEEDEDEGLSDADAAHVRRSLRHFLSVHHGGRFTPRSLARIFHGIGSPCYPAEIYGRDRRFWRQLLHVGFNQLTKMAAQEIIALNGIP